MGSGPTTNIITGENMGYGIGNSLAIEMDTYQNTDVGDPNANHIGLDFGGSVTSVGTTSPSAQLTNGLPWYVWIDYTASIQQLAVRVSTTSTKPAATTISSTVNLYSTFGNSSTLYLGFTGSTGYYYQRQRVISMMLYVDQCTSSPCVNGGTCVNIFNNFTCTCVAGWTGQTCSQEINNCASNPCSNAATCTNLFNNVSCACVAGWGGHLCNVEADNCASNPCLNGATCTNLFNNVSCACAVGWGGFTCNQGKEGYFSSIKNHLSSFVSFHFNSSSELTCGPVNEGIANELWPTTQAGQNATVACPLPGYNGTAFRSCLANQTWGTILIDCQGDFFFFSLLLFFPP